MKTEDIIERIWVHTEPSVYISRNEFLAGLAGWDIRSIGIDGEIAGATLTKGPEFHFVSFGLHKVFPPMLIKECLQPIIDEHGFVLTKTPKDDARQCRFNIRIGFRRQSEDEYYTYFRMTQLNLHGARKCLS